MKIRYIYIEKYKDIIEDLNLNISGGYKYFYENNKITREVKEQYINDFYKEYNCIDEISAIIGKNSSGKTTILRLINDILGYNYIEFKYIIIYEISHKIFYSSNIDKLSYKGSEYIHSSDFIRNEKIGTIFFSSIFDKSTCLSGNHKLLDISTNKLLRLYIENYNYKELKNILDDSGYVPNNNILREKFLESDIIDSFKKEEILKIIEYFSRINELNDETSFKSLIGLPKYLNISYGYNRIGKEENLLKLEKKNKRAYEYLRKVDDAIDFYILEGDGFSNKQQYMNEFLSMLIFEIFYWLIYIDERDIIDIMDLFINKISNEHSDIYMNNVITDIINMILKKDIEDIILDDEDIILDDEDSNETIYNDIQNEYYILDEVIIEINNIIDILEYDFQDDSLIEKIEACKLQINEVLIENYSLKLEEIKENLNIIIQSIEDNNYYIEDVVYNMINNVYDLQVIKEIKCIDNINYEENQENIKIEKIDKKINENIYQKEKDGLYEYLEQNLKEYIESIEELIEYQYNLLIDNDVVIDKEEILNIQAKWSGNEIINFIEKFNSFDFNTFYLSYNHEDLSSGQNAYLDMVSRLISSENKLKMYEHIIFLIDEGDINLHPEIQIEFVKNLGDFLQSFFSDKKFHIIFTSNSPFILSDILHTNIIYLEKRETIKNTQQNIRKIRTFGANINDLLINNFFMKSIVGAFANEKINNLINDLSTDLYEEKYDEEQAKHVKKSIEILADDLIKNKLREMYIDKYSKDNQDIDNEIDYYKRKIEELRRKKK